MFMPIMFLQLICSQAFTVAHPRGGDEEPSIPQPSAADKKRNIHSNEDERIAISVDVSRYDGGDINIYEVGVGGEERFEIARIETLLKRLYGMNVKYLDFNQKELEKVWNGLIYTAHLLFLSNHLKWKKNEKVQIWEVLKEISKEDTRWIMPGNELKFNQPYQQFKPRFYGHAVAILNRQMKEGHQQKEIARFHLSLNGFRIYKKIKIDGKIVGKSYFIRENIKNHHLDEIEETEIAAPKKRGIHFREEFLPALFVKKGLNDIEALKEVAWKKVVAGKEYSFAKFTCMHFVYKFILLIANINASNQKLLTNLVAWPEEMQRFSEFQRANRNIPNPFHKVLKELEMEKQSKSGMEKTKENKSSSVDRKKEKNNQIVGRSRL